MIIGITGGIGSGKSYIAQALVQQGFYRYDCDAQAKRIISTDTHLMAALTALLGEQTYVNGTYNTHYVASRVFNNPALLAQLNAIVHPAVKADILRLADSTIHRITDSPILVESAILFESGIDTICDKVIAVIAPDDIRLQRVMQRDHATQEQIKARMRAQMSTSELIAKAQIVINNDGQTPIDELCQSIMQHL